ncbi:unnamed protein product [Arctogadus glacialis]
MESKGPNFTVAETYALLEGVQANFATIVGGFSSAKGGEVTKKGKDTIWEDITNRINALGSGQKRTLKQVTLRWKNLRAKATKDLSEAKNPCTGNKPYKRGEYTDMVLDIVGGEKSEALHGIEGVERNGEATMTEAGECEPNPPAEEFVLDLTPAIEEDNGSPLTMEPVVSRVAKTKRKHSSGQDGDAYERGAPVMEPPWLWFSIYITAPPYPPLPTVRPHYYSAPSLPCALVVVRSNYTDRWVQGLAGWLSHN